MRDISFMRSRSPPAVQVQRFSIPSSCTCSAFVSRCFSVLQKLAICALWPLTNLLLFLAAGLVNKSCKFGAPAARKKQGRA